MAKAVSQVGALSPILEFLQRTCKKELRTARAATVRWICVSDPSRWLSGRRSSGAWCSGPWHVHSDCAAGHRDGVQTRRSDPLHVLVASLRYQRRVACWGAVGQAGGLGGGLGGGWRDALMDDKDALLLHATCAHPCSAPRRRTSGGAQYPPRCKPSAWRRLVRDTHNPASECRCRVCVGVVALKVVACLYGDAHRRSRRRAWQAGRRVARIVAFQGQLLLGDRVRAGLGLGAANHAVVKAEAQDAPRHALRICLRSTTHAEAAHRGYGRRADPPLTRAPLGTRSVRSRHRVLVE